VTAEDWQVTARVKVGGAWALHDAAERYHAHLDTFVLYGSLAGLIGNPGQAAYSAANAALMGLVQHRRARGLPATALHWGPWSDGGMVTGDIEARLRIRGVRAMNPQRALDALGQVLDEDRDALAVFDADWPRLARAMTAMGPRPLLQELPEVQAVLVEDDVAVEASAGSGPVLRQQLLRLPKAERRSHLFRHLEAAVASALGQKQKRAIDPRQGFRDMGLDSLMAVDLRQRVRKLTGLTIPVSLAFDYPNLDALTDGLLDRIDRSAVQAAIEGLSSLTDEQWKDPRLNEFISSKIDAPAADIEVEALPDDIAAVIDMVEQLSKAG
jgi:acyl carrier protein